jgi:glutathione S-transferase
VTVILYELKAKGEIRFSPYCWRTRMALAHKGIEPELVPVGFSEKQSIAFSGQQKVPIIVDDGTCVFDSWTIACYLEERYPDRPSLFAGNGGLALARFINHWCDKMVHPRLTPLLVGGIADLLEGEDRAYFLTTRQDRLKQAVQTEGEAAACLQRFAEALTPMRETLAERPFVSGVAPAYADYILMGCFQQARSISPVALLDPADPVFAWRTRMMGLFDGLLVKAAGHPV